MFYNFYLVWALTYCKIHSVCSILLQHVHLLKIHCWQMSPCWQYSSCDNILLAIHTLLTIPNMYSSINKTCFYIQLCLYKNTRPSHFFRSTSSYLQVAFIIMFIWKRNIIKMATLQSHANRKYVLWFYFYLDVKLCNLRFVCHRTLFMKEQETN